MILMGTMQVTIITEFENEISVEVVEIEIWVPLAEDIIDI